MNGATVQNTNTISGLSSGWYTITFTDGAGCEIIDSAEVLAFSPILIELEVIQKPTCTFNNGEINAIVSGGVTPYNYLWSNAQTTTSSTGLKDGFVSLFITDASFCSQAVGLELERDSAPRVTFTVFDASCGEDNGEIRIIRTGGKPPIDYTWSNGSTDYVIENLAVGNYILTITDANNCIVIDSTNIERNEDLCLNIPSAFTPNNDGTNDTWIIRGSEYYDDIKVEIFNRWGSLLFTSDGYKTPWDGYYNGKELPSAVYYYIVTIPSIDYSNTGSVTIRK
jgi:trimeric autotransporter adhesin